MIHTISLRSSLLILAPDVVCLRIGVILREATVYCAAPLSFSSHAWQLGPDNLCLAPVNRRQPPHPPPTNEAGRMAIHPQGGSWCATVQMLITGATLANWQSPIQRSPCECSKSRACVSLLIPDVDWFSGSPCWPLFHNTTLHPPPPPGCPSMLTDRVVSKTPTVQARPGVPLLCGGTALWPFDRLPSGRPSSSCQSSLRVQSPEQKCLVYTNNWVNRPGLGVGNPQTWTVNVISTSLFQDRHDTNEYYWFIRDLAGGQKMKRFLQQKEFWEERGREARKLTQPNFICYVNCSSFCKFRPVVGQSQASNSMHLNTNSFFDLVLARGQNQRPKMTLKSHGQASHDLGLRYSCSATFDAPATEYLFLQLHKKRDN